MKFRLILSIVAQKKWVFVSNCMCLLFFLIFFITFELPINVYLYAALLFIVTNMMLIAAIVYRSYAVHRALMHIKNADVFQNIVFPRADTLEQSDYQDIIRILEAHSSSVITDKDRRYEDMMVYDTLWIHQIKVPIAAMRLILQTEYKGNNSELNSELFRIEEYVQMMLYFHRLDTIESDLLFRKYNLYNIVCDALRKYSKIFIRKKLSIDFEPFEKYVITDEKWLRFIIEQVLSNSLKYTKTGTITITYDKETDELVIKDTGIGIAKEDISRVFERGFTGNNGREERHSTGIGMYLTKHIIDKLSHTITIDSEINKGTNVRIGFRNNT